MYNGDEKLVFSIDLGTTNSGVSFAHLQAGTTPHVRSVTRWPGQEDAAGDSKLPTLVRYKGGRAISYGAEALEEPDDDDTHLARWFKLHLHPQAMRTTPNFEVPPLPPKVTLKQVYADFLAFIFAHAREFFATSMHDGERILERLDGSLVLVLATPNGWDTTQHGFLRDAVYRAGILPRDAPDERLQFVSEAEASVHFALERTRGDEWLVPGTNFAVLDAGGSTVDTTVYRCLATVPKMKLEEVTGSECVQAGSVFVNRDAEQLLKMKLANSKYGRDEYIYDMMEIFEKKTKRRFDGSDDPSVIAFGRMQDNDTSCNISRGRITLTSDEVKLAFQNSLSDIVGSCARILERSKHICDVILLVGGYADSPYLRSTLKEKLTLAGVQFVTVDDGIKKAAAEGATIWYTKQLVQARAVRAHFANMSRSVFDNNSDYHHRLEKERPEAKGLSLDGYMRIGQLFHTIASKHEVIAADKPKIFNYTNNYDVKPSREGMKEFQIGVYAYDGDKAPDWLFVRYSRTTLSPGVRKVCDIRADLSALYDSLEMKVSDNGQNYWQIKYSVNVLFGTTTLQAEIEWKENGILKKSPVQAIPDSFV